MATEAQFTLGDEASPNNGASGTTVPTAPEAVSGSPPGQDTTLHDQAPGSASSLLASALAGGSRLFTNAKARATATVASVTGKALLLSREGSMPGHGGPGSGETPAEADAVTSGPNSLSVDAAAAYEAAKARAAAAVAATTDITRKARETGTSMYRATADGVKRLMAPARKVAPICRHETSTKPCPQVVLVLSTCIVSHGLSTKDIFKEEAPAAAVEALTAQLDGNMLLVPSSLDPILAASALKHFLSSLDEPLLMTKLADKWIAAGAPDQMDALAAIKETLKLLPLANLSTLRVVLDVCYRVAAKSTTTGMNAYALAQALAPALLWKVSPLLLLRTPTLNINVAANVQALRAKLTGQPQSVRASCVDSAADACASTGAPEGANQAAGQVVAAADVAPGQQEIHRLSGDLDDHNLTVPPHEDEDTELPAGTRMPLAGAELEAVVRTLEFAIIAFDEL